MAGCGKRGGQLSTSPDPTMSAEWQLQSSYHIAYHAAVLLHCSHLVRSMADGEEPTFATKQTRPRGPLTDPNCRYQHNMSAQEGSPNFGTDVRNIPTAWSMLLRGVRMPWLEVNTGDVLRSAEGFNVRK